MARTRYERNEMWQITDERCIPIRKELEDFFEKFFKSHDDVAVPDLEQEIMHIVPFQASLCMLKESGDIIREKKAKEKEALKDKEDLSCTE